jgi:hypothetical protein
MWVVKTEEHAIYAYCPVCKQDEVMIHGWEDTLWAEGMMEPLPPPDSTVQTRGNRGRTGRPAAQRRLGVAPVVTS